MRPVVVIEPSMMAAANFARTRREAEAIVVWVTGWAKWAARGRLVQMVQLSDMIQVLFAVNCFPSTPVIRNLLGKFGLQEVYSPEDIARSINTILERAAPLHDVLGIETSACGVCTTVPNIIPADIDPELQHADCRTFASIICSPLVKVVNQPIFVASRARGLIRIRAHVDEIWCSAGCPHIHVPFTAIGDIHSATIFDAIVRQVGAAMIWSTATEPQHFHLAIAARAAEILSESGPLSNLASVPMFEIGSQFCRSLQRVGAGPDGPFAGAALESCARVVLGDPRKAAKPFLKAPGSRHGKWTQRTRSYDKALAFRTHVTTGHEALRLMFWRSPTNNPELANIGPKAELAIEEGTKGAAINGS